MEPTLLANLSLPKIDVGVTTDKTKINHDYKTQEGDGKPIEEQLKAHEEQKLAEKEEELERKKGELLHFFGSETFNQMQDLPNDVIQKYLTKKGIEPEIPHFPWIKEYKRFIEKCKKSEPLTRDKKEHYNLTEELQKAKQKEWWYRQKYKLMKALKSKLNSKKNLLNTKDFKIQKVNKLPANEIDHNHLQATSISFEKIPLLKQQKKETDEVTAETSIISNNGGAVNRSTNTGPDVILMLNDLKKDKREKSREIYDVEAVKEESELPRKDRFTTISPTNAYRNQNKPFKRGLNRSEGSLSQVMETQTQNPYKSSSPQLRKTQSSWRYATSKKLKPLKSPKLDKYTKYRIQNICRLEKQITGVSDSSLSHTTQTKIPRKNSKCEGLRM